ncbi:MAG: transposase, partial [Fibrobacteraceae bacterium]|nr:transposase [Fibrobacteraceae bacterium]
CVIWAHEGYGKNVLEIFMRQLSVEQRESVELVTCDGARWIRSCIEEYLPNAERCVDGFHVVQWATEAMDKVRAEA